MNRRSLFVFVAVLVVACLALVIIFVPERPSTVQPPAAAIPEDTSPVEVAKETTIRNLTRDAVTFVLRPSRGTEPAVSTRSLDPQTIERVLTAVPLLIEFNNGQEDQVFTLDAGTAYTFRYDEKGQIQIFQGSHGRTDAADLAPYVPTPAFVVDRMLEMAALTKDDVVYDLGCGDGRIVVAAAKKYGARGVGIDIDEQRIEESRINALLAGVDNRVRFVVMDATKTDFSDATVVAIYLLPESNELLRPLFEKQLRPGSRVVCHNYTVPGWEGTETDSAVLKDEKGEEHKIFLYRR